MKRFLFTAVLLSTVAGYAETLGFWDFRDGEPPRDFSGQAQGLHDGALGGVRH